MFYHQLKIAWRKITQQKGFTILNLLGLSVGLAATMLMVAYVYHQYSFDRFHEKDERLYETTSQFKHGERTFNVNRFSSAFGPIVEEQVPGVEAFVRTQPRNNVVLATEDGFQKHVEQQFSFVYSNFLDVFTFELLAGDKKQVLQHPFSVVITTATAKKYFGAANPIGKTLNFLPDSDNLQQGSETGPAIFPFTVTGVIAEAPGNSSLQFDFLASFSSLRQIEPLLFEHRRAALGSFITYFLLDETQTAQEVSSLIASIVNEGREDESTVELKTLPDIYFDESTRKRVGLFAGIAFLVLLLAIVNYAGLTTARSLERAKEVGVRKTLGAHRIQLVGQFFGESTLLVGLASVGALLLSWIGLPIVSQLADSRLGFHVFYQPAMLLALAFILLLTIVLAGSYPALALSRFLPAGVLRGRNGGLRGERTRRFLLVFQFVISAALIVCSLVMQQQMRHLAKRDLGFKQDQLLVIPFETQNEGAFGALKSACKQESGVTAAGISTAVPFRTEGTNIFFVETPSGEPISLYFISVDRDFLSTLGVDWADGGPAGPTLFGNGMRAIINQTAFQQLGLKTGVGERILHSNSSAENQGYEVTGVIEDYAFSDYKNPVGPQVLFEVSEVESHNLTRPAYLTLRLEAGTEIQPLMARLEAIYDGFQPLKPFDFFFVDDQYQNLYRSETRTATLFSLFTLLAIAIACLGLFGLSAYLAERRSKEIGVRKVFGATVAQLVGLLSKDFLMLMGIALLIALPLAWYFMNRWLEDFAFRIELEWWLFALASVLAMGIAFLTVSFQSVKAALANPVESLRNE